MSSTPLLPQNDPNTQARQKSLQTSQDEYQYKYDYQALDGVAMAKGVPDGEKPKLKWITKAIRVAIKIAKNKLYNDLEPNDHLSPLKIAKDFVKFQIKLKITNQDPLEALLSLAKHFVIENKNKVVRPQDLDDYNKYFKSLDIPEISQNFQEDGIFARMQVAGQNPIMLTCLNTISADFPVTDALLQSVAGFENDTLAAASSENRLYFTDYIALKDIVNGDSGSGQKYSYAPKTLFAIPLNAANLKTALRPIAIQCGQVVDDNNPIFNPNDGMAWEIAKTIVQIADFNYHELITHLAATHLLIEPFVVTTHRQLADNHPLKLLLLPHFEGTIFINWGAQESLVADGGPFDKMFSGTMASNRQLVGARLQKSFNEAMLIKDLERRGVNNDKLFYPYRDDALKLWQATADWVSDYLDLYYPDDNAIIDDTELQAWANELVSGGQVKGFGDNEGDGEKITTLKYLKEAVTMVIFTGSSQHAAVNFTQRDFSGYTPNMPAAGYSPAPENKDKTEQDWYDVLPPFNIANDQVDLTQLLSGVNYTTLGKYKRRHFKDRRVRDPLDDFATKLEDIEDEIEERNEEAKVAGVAPYIYMLPSKIPQSINI